MRRPAPTPRRPRRSSATGSRSTCSAPASRPTSARISPAGLAPNKPAEAALDLAVPSAPGDYLLVLDIVTPERGSLAAAGIDPTIIRIHVVAPVVPTPAPDGNPGGTTARKSTSGADAAP